MKNNDLVFIKLLALCMCMFAVMIIIDMTISQKNLEMFKGEVASVDRADNQFMLKSATGDILVVEGQHANKVVLGDEVAISGEYGYSIANLGSVVEIHSLQIANDMPTEIASK